MWRTKIVTLHGINTRAEYKLDEMGLSIVIKEPYFWYFTTDTQWGNAVKRLEENIAVSRFKKLRSNDKLPSNDKPRSNDKFGDLILFEEPGETTYIGMVE